jgi:hypothetical protein
MAANRIGQLYQYTGKGSIPLWETASSFSYNELGRIEANIPFLIIEKRDEPDRHEYWIKVLVEDKVGWVKSTYLNIDWVDPEEYDQ